MRCSFDSRFRNITAACLLSAFAAGAISALVTPVTAEKAPVIVISVDRATKGNRLPLPLITHPTRHNSISTKKPILQHALPGCESAFSPLADPTRGHLLTHCAA